MTTFSRPLKEPVLMLAALAYFAVLAVLLVQRHMAPDVILPLAVGAGREVLALARGNSG